EPVEHQAAAPFGHDETVAPQHGQVLRDVRRLESGRLEEFGDRRLGHGREHFEDADADGVCEALEEPGLDLVQRAVQVAQHPPSFLIHAVMISSYRYMLGAWLNRFLCVPNAPVSTPTRWARCSSARCAGMSGRRARSPRHPTPQPTRASSRMPSATSSPTAT